MDWALVAEIDWQATGQLLLNILKVAAGLGFVIFVHELGHFLVAKACGVKCEKFYVGFDIPLRLGPVQLPSRLGRFQWGETEYGIGILPLGGYVKMLGQDDDPRNAQKESDRIRLQKGDTAGSSDDQGYELDPRSFPAKPVPQRMAIISAGVIMNLIFAVLFAMFAFNAGVPYTPTEIGGTVPGSPAWEAGLQPDSRIIQIGRDGRRSEKLRFDWDLSHSGVGLAQDQEDLPLLVRQPDGEEQWVMVRPVMTQKAKGKIPMIGVAPARTLTIGDFFPNSPAKEASPPLQPGDRIVAINGSQVQSATELEQHLARVPDETVTLTVERPGKEDQPATIIESKVAPHPLQRLGLIMRHGPVTGIRPGSPAEAAGFQVGDQLLRLNGQPLGDPITLPARLRPLHGEEVVFTVRRGSQELDIPITPETPRSFDWTVSTGFPMAAESLGLAYAITLEVAGVEAGSPAEKAGLKSGDVLTEVAFKSTDPQKPTDELVNGGKPLQLATEGFDWMFVFGQLQYLDPDAALELGYRRGEKVHVAVVRPVASEFTTPDRGLALEPKQEIYTAESWAEALSLGFRQTKEDSLRVVRFLRKLVTGEISPMNLGGPLSIAYVANSEASQGLPRLLMFLTFLSANLAVLNFMPIPALDGGHMLFLAAEGIRGKPVDERMQFALTLAGVACLLGLMIFVFGLDIHRLFL